MKHSHHGWQPYPVLWLGLRYCIFYIAFALLTRALVSIASEGGFGSALPGFALGLVLGAEPLRRTFQRRQTLFDAVAPRFASWSGLCATVVALTTLAIYLVEGITILLALLLMRGGVLAMAPLIDVAGGRLVDLRATAALALSLAAVAIGIASVTDVGDRRLLLILLALYLGASAIRLWLMLRYAKLPVPGLRAIWMVCELRVILVLLLIAGSAALILAPFPSFLHAVTAVAAGAAYAAVFCWGSSIYLDPWSTSRAVVINRGSSMLAGVIASLVAVPLLSASLPGATTWLAAGLVTLALILTVPGHGSSANPAGNPPAGPGYGARLPPSPQARRQRR